MQGHFAIGPPVSLISEASMRLGYHGTLTGTFLFVMNVYEKSEGFEDLHLIHMRKQISRELSKSSMFQLLFLAVKLRDINWQRREY